MSFSIIAAVGKNRELGKNNGLIWHLSNDLAFFKKTTMQHPIVMGRKTYESLPGLLPGRKHYVISRSSNSLPDDVAHVSDLEKFISERKDDSTEYFVIGGASIYSKMLPYCDKIYLTEIEAEDKKSDVFFPKFDKKLYDKKIIQQGEENDLNYVISCYIKK